MSTMNSPAALSIIGNATASGAVGAQPVDVREFINGRPMTATQWLILMLCFLLVMADGMDVAIMGFLVPAITHEWHVARSLFGLVMGAAPVGLAVGAMLAGPPADRYGRKRVLLVSVMMFGFFSVISAFATGVTSLALMRFLTGLGLGASMPCTTTLLSEYVPERMRSLLITCMFTGFNLGSALIGFIAAAVIPAHGWRAVLVIGGLIPLILLPFYGRWLPESARFMVVRGEDAAKIAKILGRVCHTKVSAAGGFIVRETHVSTRKPINTLVSSNFLQCTLTLWLAYFMGLVTIYLVNGWMPTLITDAGLSIAHAANTTALFQIGGTVGAIVVGFAMDRFVPQRVIGLAYLGGALSIVLLAYLGALSGIFAMVVTLAGFCISGAQTGLNAYAPGCYPTPVRATGVSWMLGVGRFGSILGSLIGGILLSLGWGLSTILGALAVPAVIAAIASFRNRAPSASLMQGARI